MIICESVPSEIVSETSYVPFILYTISVGFCSSDVAGTPPIAPPTDGALQEAASRLVDGFNSGLGSLDFVKVEKPLIVKEHKDLRKLPAELDYDTDALLVGFGGALPLERHTLGRYGLPVIGGANADFLKGLRVKKFLKQSKFLYIGEIPSFSAPNGPYDFPAIEDRLGVRVRHIETNEFYRWFDRFPENEVKKELENWRKQFDRVLEPDENELMNATRVYLALRYLCEREDANGLTVNCGRFTEERPVVPCLAFDRLIDEGGTAIFGEITEMIGAEHVLARRAKTPEVAEQILKVVHELEEKIKSLGVDIRGSNPTPGNIRGGLSTIEEKSLGAIVKGGSKPIQGVLDYAEKPDGKGLYIMISPGREIEFLTGPVAGGAQIVIFTTGRGAPQGYPIAPVIKVCGNPRTSEKLSEHIDVDVSDVITEDKTLEEAAEKVFEKLVKVASGEKTKAEIIGYDKTIDIYVRGIIL